jgi:probable F420-dependent oxidoreductase
MRFIVKIGAVLPQTEIGADPGSLRTWATTVESLGYRHVLAYDHVVGADPDHHPGWDGPYDVDSTFHEPFVLFGHLSALTSLELVTAVLVLPQRQTALVAKQAAQVDLLTGGRFRLGVGVGWNAVEYQALGEGFEDRGRRIDEQIAVLRQLWTSRSASFVGDFHTLDAVGLAPAPRQRPIPVWIGGSSAPAYRRTGRLADGWFPQVEPGPDLDAAQAVVEDAALEAGRDPSDIGMEARVQMGRDGVEPVLEAIERWRAAGATHLSVSTLKGGLVTVEEHLEALRSVATHLDLGDR